MSVPMAGHKRVVIVGATGMVGGHARCYALNHPAVASARVKIWNPTASNSAISAGSHDSTGALRRLSLV
jgi:N-acetyl-gamma-glutamylphosphate reductase